MKKQKGFKVEAVISIVLILLALAAVFLFRGGFSQSNKESKEALNTVQVDVVNENEDYQKTYTYGTKDKTLGDLLVNEKLVEYQDSDYGRFITAVDGMKADDSKELWWNVEVNGESAQTGVDSIEIKDGDVYTLTMMKGY